MKRPGELQRYTGLRSSAWSTRSGDAGQGGKTRQRARQTPRRRDTGPTPKVREAVLERDEYRCVRCGVDVRTVADHSLQHRRARGMGGTRRPETNSPAALLTVCGSGTTRCHGHMEAHPHESLGTGWRIPQAASTPADWPVLTADRGRIYLDDDGGWRHA